MKHNIFFKALVLALLVAGGFGFQGKSQDSCATAVIRTYMNGVPIPWDSVEVRNKTRHTTFWLYYPDTILSNCTNAIPGYETGFGPDFLENFPNPCQGNTTIRFGNAQSGDAVFSVYDLQGRLCLRQSLALPAGTHELRLSFPHSGVYFLHSSVGGSTLSRKIVCTEGAGRECEIRLLTSTAHGTEKDARGGEGLFSATDDLSLWAYITDDGQVKKSDWATTVNHEHLDGTIYPLYTNGVINIGYAKTDSTAQDFSLANKTYRIIYENAATLPYTEFPHTYTITFADSTFVSMPESEAGYGSGCWYFEGTYKYRYYPQFEALVIRRLDEDLPSEDATYISHYASSANEIQPRRVRTHTNCAADFCQEDPYYGCKGSVWVVLDE
ncbi:MAG: T9SS type A sorting domain-containing protein [Bacteroidales bacterium]|nr:T9SS type A sorting domain-containing protein [Bacteroidales bacterium]